jgi:hypothetical protein
MVSTAYGILRDKGDVLVTMVYGNAQRTWWLRVERGPFQAKEQTGPNYDPQGNPIFSNCSARVEIYRR